MHANSVKVCYFFNFSGAKLLQRMRNCACSHKHTYVQKMQETSFRHTPSGDFRKINDAIMSEKAVDEARLLELIEQQSAQKTASSAARSEARLLGIIGQKSAQRMARKEGQFSPQEARPWEVVEQKATPKTARNGQVSPLVALKRTRSDDSRSPIAALSRTRSVCVTHTCGTNVFFVFGNDEMCHRSYDGVDIDKSMMKLIYRSSSMMNYYNEQKITHSSTTMTNKNSLTLHVCNDCFCRTHAG
jgi:hypothetical protein